MCDKIVLRNYSEYNQYMIWNGNIYEPIDKDKLEKSEQGIIGYTENKELVGIFVKKSEVYFLNNNIEIRIDKSNFKCSNSYIETTRHFKLENQNSLVFESVYEPYIDPGMIIYDADPEEFDFLLFLSNNILLNKESLENYILAITEGI